ncbi:pro-adrenomedullin [Xenopus laevis]|uniref:Pro-adrenomedullin n=2 Tax=Xenopus laevis TaxID=8355 RepID=A0A974HMM6_XENLA|nr:pro-adrenomedullin [Xenopus laevis]OCT83659.1 hypothetical protein XELAEV_18021801mg [Xenopus laevis]
MDLCQAILLLHFICLTFLGLVAGRMEFIPGDRKKWSSLGMNRLRRDLKVAVQSAPATDVASESSFVKNEDVKGPLNSQHSSNDAHIRVKRYRHTFHHLQSVRVGCRFGTCTVQNLAHQIFQYTDKDKDSTAPVNKISSQGYGRRRRSLPDKKLQLTVMDGHIKPHWVSTSTSRNQPGGHQPKFLDVISAGKPSQGRETWKKGKMLQILLKT